MCIKERKTENILRKSRLTIGLRQARKNAGENGNVLLLKAALMSFSASSLMDLLTGLSRFSLIASTGARRMREGVWLWCGATSVERCHWRPRSGFLGSFRTKDAPKRTGHPWSAHRKFTRLMTFDRLSRSERIFCNLVLVLLDRGIKGSLGGLALEGGGSGDVLRCRGLGSRLVKALHGALVEGILGLTRGRLLLTRRLEPAKHACKHRCLMAVGTPACKKQCISKRSPHGRPHAPRKTTQSPHTKRYQG